MHNREITHRVMKTQCKSESWDFKDSNSLYWIYRRIHDLKSERSYDFSL